MGLLSAVSIALLLAVISAPAQAQVPGVSKHGKDQQELVDFLKHTDAVENSPARKYEKNFEPSINRGSSGATGVQIFLPGLIHNAALHQPCIASSYYGEGAYSQYLSIEDKFVERDFSKYSAENANDGFPYSTFWWSARVRDDEEVSWEVRIPLGIRLIDHINIRWYGWNSAADYIISASDSRGGNPLWTDKMIVTGMPAEFDRLDKLIPLDAGWPGEDVFHVKITMKRHIQCTDKIRCGRSRVRASPGDQRRIYGIREVEVIGYDSGARQNFVGASLAAKIVTLCTTYVLAFTSW